VQSIQIRPFERSDREQLTALVNTHIGAVVPGVSVSVNVLMSQLEREPAEAIVDPWVVERRTLVAVERDAVVAGAHLLRYGSDEQLGESYRNAAEIRWLVFAPAATEAADALLAASIATLDAWQPSRQYADGSLPALGCYGVPAAWPHLRDAYVRAGFDFVGRVEIILVSQVDDLPELGEPPLLGLTIQREVGQFGRSSRRCSTASESASSTSMSTRPQVAPAHASPAGATSATSTSPKSTVASTSEPGCSPTPGAGFDSGASTDSSTTPGPSSTTCSGFSARPASRS
jgi:hypothetical protein